MSYLDTTAQFYAAIAETPDLGACCAQKNELTLPGLVVPERMAGMSYGCGTTVHADELKDAPTVLYVGIGGGLEALQFAWFSRREAGVIAVDPVAAMREAALANLGEAAELNAWFDESFVNVLAGDAFNLPAATASVDLVAQNCLFNIFERADLRRALREAHRVLKPGGRLMMSDPIATRPIPEQLRQDQRLRAMCLSGALTYDEYLDELYGAGFARIEVRAKKHYRTLASEDYALDQDLVLESLDTVSRRSDAHATRQVFTGRRAIYTGPQEDISLDGIVLKRHEPRNVSDETAQDLLQRWPQDVLITSPTYRHTS